MPDLNAIKLLWDHLKFKKYLWNALLNVWNVSRRINPKDASYLFVAYFVMQWKFCLGRKR